MPVPRSATGRENCGGAASTRSDSGTRKYTGVDLRAVVTVVAFIAGFTAYVYAVGWIANWLRLAAARLPVDIVSSYPTSRVFGDGLRSTALSGVVFAVLCFAAYLTSARRWQENRVEWHSVVGERGVGRVRAGKLGEEREREWAEHRERAKDRLRHPSHSWRRFHTRLRASGAKLKPSAVRASAKRGVMGTSAKETAAEEDTSIGDRGVRIVAGFNMMLAGALCASAAAVAIDELWNHPAWYWVLFTWIAVFALVREVLARHGPLWLGARVQGAFWLLVVAAALFASAPLGVLVLAGVVMATFGRVLARTAHSEQPVRVRGWVASPIPWALFAVTALLAFAYQAIPPVSFPGVILTTTAGAQQTGGYLSQSRDGVLLAQCHQHLDAASVDERVLFVPASAVKTITLGGRSQVFDTGKRSSLVALVQKALGLNQTLPTLITVDLRPRRTACLGGATPSQEHSAEGALGSSVVADPDPHHPPHQANDGEQPISVPRKLGAASKEGQPETPAEIAELALRYQPTVEVSVADRNWPVSVGALLADRGVGANSPTCLVRARASSGRCAHPPQLEELTAEGSSTSDYLQYPPYMMGNPSPTLEIEAFERGQGISVGPLEHWRSEPMLLNPWKSAQVYFYYAGDLTPASWGGARDSRVRGRLETLEYWFFYPYNYFPLIVRSNVMPDNPIAAELLSVDFHQGDWEHVDVLLEPSTHSPLWLYMARHNGEGVFIPWGDVPMILEGTHPIIRAAFGGHPSYPPVCGAQKRAQTGNALSDWLVCGESQFAFKAETTPLVDIARTSWACWKGRFGEAAPGVELHNATKPESVLDKLRGQVYVAGPIAPLRQAENGGVCELAEGEKPPGKPGVGHPAYHEEHPG